jgi:hypothetical protein
MKMVKKRRKNQKFWWLNTIQSNFKSEGRKFIDRKVVLENRMHGGWEFTNRVLKRELPLVSRLDLQA